MRITKYCYRLFYAIPLTVGILAQVASTARAEDVYPPGWNLRNESMGPILYDFRAGCWGDYRRYWPEQKSCMEGVPSRPIPYGAIVYQFKAGGQHYHRVEGSGPHEAMLGEAR
jgi:hypothetical protein